MPFKLGLTELLMIVMVIFGAGKLPQIGSSMAKAIRGFRHGQSEADEEVTTTTRKERERK